MNDGRLMHAVEFGVVDLVSVDHGCTGHRQGASMPPALRRPLAQHRSRRLDQLANTLTVGPGEPDADGIEDEDARSTDDRLRQILVTCAAHVLGKHPDRIAY